ncbi:MAG TPA: ATP-dependent DNA helicase [Planctomycetota bacterium]|nr:ATP-dependent DNA helicase [Planctomycetota bacterium]
MLTPDQRNVVEAPIDRCVIVNAGPGTGKTHVLVERFHWLVAEKGIAIPDVLMVTFTRKAAREMKERLARRLLETKLVASALELETAWVTNFHGLCYRLLRENALAAEFDPGSRILDEIESAEVGAGLRREFLNSNVAASALDAEAAGNPIPSAVVDRVSYKFSEALGVLDRAKENLLGAGDLISLSDRALEPFRAHEGAREECTAQDHLVRSLPEIEAAYKRAKGAEALVDYVDLQTRAVELLRSESGVPLRSHFRVILVDEFQDTNLAQLRILELLAARGLSNVMVVGDERQAIYSFRGARLENLRELPARVKSGGGDALHLDLYESFRSYQEILDAATRALPEGTAPSRALIASALGSAAKDPSAPRPVVRAIRCDSKDREADRIADEIARLRGQRITGVGADGTREAITLSWGDFAILLRSVGSARAYEEALRARGVPYRTFGGTGFFDRREILDLLAYLRAIANPYDSLALARILQNPPFGLSDRSLYGLANVQFTGSATAQLEKDAHENLVILSERLKPFDALRRALDEPELARSLGIEDQCLGRLKRLREFLERSVRRRGAVPVSRLLLEVLAETGYGKLLLADEQHGPLEALRRRKNVERLLRLARRFEERSVYGSLEELVRYLERAISDEIREEEEGVEADSRVVNVMTVHQAKGKEWPVVFVAGLTDRSWPMRGWPNELVFFDRAGPVLRKHVIGQDGDSKVDYTETQLHASLAAADALEHDHEERRVFFVAMTRAKNLLHLTGYGQRTAYLNLIAADFRDGAPPALAAPFAEPSEQTASPSADVERRVSAALHGLRSLPDDTPTRLPVRTNVVHLSFSHVDVFDTCPLKYKFTFVTPLPGLPVGRGLRPRTGAEAGAPAELTPTELGTMLHDALERWAREEQPLEELARKAANDRGWSTLHPSDEGRVKTFVGHFLASRLGTSKPAPENVEVPFTILLHEGDLTVSVTGAIDRLDPEADGTWTITDYKTNRGVEPERYKLQLSIYRLATERVLGRRVSACRAYFVRYPEAVGLVDLPIFSTAETEHRIIQAAKRIAARDYTIPEHPGAATCWRCPFGGTAGFCPAKRLDLGPQ